MPKQQQQQCRCPFPETGANSASRPEPQTVPIRPRLRHCVWTNSRTTQRQNMRSSRAIPRNRINTVPKEVLPLTEAGGLPGPLNFGRGNQSHPREGTSTGAVVPTGNSNQTPELPRNDQLLLKFHARMHPDNGPSTPPHREGVHETHSSTA